MKRAEAIELILKDLRGELSDIQKAQIAALLESDAEFRNLYEEERALSALVEYLPNAPVSSNFTAQLMQAVAREQAAAQGEVAKEQPGRVALPWVRWGAAFMVAALLGGYGYKWNQREARQQLAQGVAAFSEVAEVIEPGEAPEVFQNFEAIRRLNTLPAEGELDMELLVALQK